MEEGDSKNSRNEETEVLKIRHVAALLFLWGDLDAD